MMDESRVHDAWYLEYLAVDPSKQGSGLGSLILKESLKVIDELGGGGLSGIVQPSEYVTL